MCDGIQSAVIHSSTAGAQWDLGGGGGELWAPGGVPYQPHPLWDSAHAQASIMAWLEVILT